MSKSKSVKIKKGILSVDTGTISPVAINKKGVITISKENRIIAKK